MSAHYYTLIVPQAPEGELDGLQGRVLEWLVAERIVEAELTDCIMSLDRHGYRPAPDFMSASSDPEDPECTNMCYARFITSKVNGLEIIQGKHITVSGEGSYVCSICPACGGERAVFDEAWNAACTDWYEHGGPGLLSCEHCGEARRLLDWSHRDPIGFGVLTFKFWNWPPLSEEFIRGMSQRLGSPLVRITGTL